VQPRRYQVTVEGELGPRYVAAFKPHQLHAHDATTTITGTIRDQAELQGLLDAVAAHGLSLISVTPLD
jgi:uncharacterized protein YggE